MSVRLTESATEKQEQKSHSDFFPREVISCNELSSIILGTRLQSTFFVPSFNQAHPFHHEHCNALSTWNTVGCIQFFLPEFRDIFKPINTARDFKDQIHKLVQSST